MIARAVVSGLGAALVLTAAAPPVHAEDRLGLSRDGRTWGPTIDGPLFDPTARWVPGDSRTATFHVRNQSSEGARLDVDLTGTGSLVGTGDLQVTAQADGGRPVPIDATGTRRLLEVDDIGQGEAVRVQVTARLRTEAGNQTQVEQVSLRFDVTLTEDVPGNESSGNAPGSGVPAEPEPTPSGVAEPDRGDPVPVSGDGGTGEGMAAGAAGAPDGVGTGSSTTATVVGIGQGRPPAAAPGGPSWLPGTGGPAGWLLLVGGLAVGIGSALVGSRGRDGPSPTRDVDPITCQHHERTDHG